MTPTYLGNTDLLHQSLVAFICSRNYSPQAVLASYDWATAQRDKVVISTFHSPLERDVMDFLLQKKQPIIYLLPARMYKRVPERFCEALNEGRLLFISLCSDTVRMYGKINAQSANRYILSLTSEVVFASIATGGFTEQLYQSLDKDKYTITILDKNREKKSFSQF